MTMKILVMGVCLGALTGCASMSEGPSLQGINRQPVNTRPTSLRIEPAPIYDQPLPLSTRLERRLDDQGRQIAELKAYLVMLQMSQEAQVIADDDRATRTESETSVRAAAPMAEVPKHNDGGTVAEPGSKIVVQGIAGKSQFLPDRQTQSALLAAAAESDHIEIRGRTDASTFSPRAKTLAIDRAVRAKAFLVAHGIAPEKIRITYQSYGDFIADNLTLEGRAQNRRVEFHMTSPLRTPTASAEMPGARP